MIKISNLMYLLALSYFPVAQGADVNTLSVHVLDQNTGLPSADLPVKLEWKSNGTWTMIAQSKTDTDGRIHAFFPAGRNMQPGIYRVTFSTQMYFERMKQETFFPEVSVLFNVSKTDEKLHIPLLLSPYGYTTYKGS
jgi:5-hydroxyisourate hydrolase